MGDTSDQWSAWFEVVPNLAVRCLYWDEYISPKVSLTWVVPHLATRYVYWSEYIWPMVNLTRHSSKLGHEMSLSGGTSDQRSAWPEVVPHLATRYVYWSEYIWPMVILTWSSSKLGLRCIYQGYIWPMVSLTWSGSKFGHKMSLLGVHLTNGQPDLK